MIRLHVPQHYTYTCTYIDTSVQQSDSFIIIPYLIPGSMTEINQIYFLLHYLLHIELQWCTTITNVSHHRLYLLLKIQALHTSWPGAFISILDTMRNNFTCVTIPMSWAVWYSLVQLLSNVGMRFSKHGWVDFKMAASLDILEHSHAYPSQSGSL